MTDGRKPIIFTAKHNGMDVEVIDLESHVRRITPLINVCHDLDRKCRNLKRALLASGIVATFWAVVAVAGWAR